MREQCNTRTFSVWRGANQGENGGNTQLAGGTKEKRQFSSVGPCKHYNINGGEGKTRKLHFVLLSANWICNCSYWISGFCNCWRASVLGQGPDPRAVRCEEMFLDSVSKSGGWGRGSQGMRRGNIEGKVPPCIFSKREGTSPSSFSIIIYTREPWEPELSLQCLIAICKYGLPRRREAL